MNILGSNTVSLTAIGLLACFMAYTFYAKKIGRRTSADPSTSMMKAAVAAGALIMSVTTSELSSALGPLAQVFHMFFLLNGCALLVTVVYDEVFKPKHKEDIAEKLVAALENNNAITEKQNRDFNEKIDKLDQTLIKFKDEMSEQVFKEVRKVIETLDEKLTKTLGDSFKELSSSVDNMVAWQASYKEHIEHQQTYLKAYVEQVGASAVGIEKIRESLGEFVKKADAVAHVTQAIHKQHPALVQSMQEMSELLLVMKDVPVQIKEDLEKVVGTIASNSQKIADFHNAVMQQANEALVVNAEQLKKLNARHNEDLARAMNKFNEDILEAHKMGVDKIDGIVADATEKHLRIYSEIFKNINGATGAATEAQRAVDDLRNEWERK